MRHIRRLSNHIGVRVRTTRREKRGARYAARQFRDLGYDVRIQRFDVDGGTSRNVVATGPGVIDHPFVVGGHIDSVQGSPGANDNASGVAVVLEIARLLAGHRQARLMKLVAFGSEEFGTNGLHHVGSQVFVNRLGNRGRARSPGMISVDMIADGIPLIVGTAGIGPRIVARALLRRARGAGIRAVYRTTCDCSDNGPFERAGIAAAFAWSGLEPNYHDPSDTVNNLNPNHLLRTGRAIRAFAKDLRPALLRRFRSR
jgi:aminopeptidase YwaD